MTMRNELPDSALSEQQHARSQRMFYILKQGLQHSSRCASIIKVYEGSRLGAVNGYEVLRRLILEFSIQTKAEALFFRQALLAFRSKQKNLRNLVNDLDSEALTYQRLLATSLDPSWKTGLAIPDSDAYRWLLLNLDNETRRFVQLHGRSETYEGGKEAVLLFFQRTVLSEQEFTGAKGQMHAFGDGSEKKPVDKSKVKCYRCGNLGHYASECPEKAKAGERSGGKSSEQKSDKGKGKGKKGKESSGGKDKGKGKKGKGKPKGKRAAEFSDETAEEHGEEWVENHETHEHESAWSEAGDEAEELRLSEFSCEPLVSSSMAGRCEQLSWGVSQFLFGVMLGVLMTAAFEVGIQRSNDGGRCLGVDRHRWREVALILGGLLCFTVTCLGCLRRLRLKVRLGLPSLDGLRSELQAGVSRVLAKPCVVKPARWVGSRRCKQVRCRRPRRRWQVVLQRACRVVGTFVSAVKVSFRALREGVRAAEVGLGEMPGGDLNQRRTLASVQKPQAASSLEVL